MNAQDKANYIDNLTFLIDQVFPWMEANPDKVDYNTFHERGTGMCTYGHYLALRHREVFRESNRTTWKEFGETLEEDLPGNRWISYWEGIFGADDQGTLEQRMPVALQYRELIKATETDDGR